MILLDWFNKIIHIHNYKSYDFIHHGYTLSWSGNVVKNFVSVEKCNCGKIKCYNGYIVPLKENVLSREDMIISFNGDDVPFIYEDKGGNSFMDYYKC